MRLFLHELRAQQRIFWRSREAAFFTFLLPIFFLVLLGSIYGDRDTIGDVKAGTYLLAGLLGYGIVSTAFAGLAIQTVVRRESGVLKRVRGTPLPPGLYLLAVIGSTLIVIALEAVIQLLIGRFLIDADMPQSPGAFIFTILLGTVAFAALGLGLTGFVRSADGSSAIVNAVYLPMVFISGVFWSTEAMPGFLRAIADVLPLTYLLELLRRVFLEEDALSHSGGAIAVIAVWGAAGLALAIRTFKWEPREGMSEA
ncbi:MAG TPA: ABC transporter permease [Gaiellaceae bacterium]|nr:ABC transporter permease [Gaiellaceae bacterium]